MAEEEKAKDQEKKKKGAEKGSGSVLGWLVLGAVILTCSGLGFGVSYMMTSPEKMIVAGDDTSKKTVLDENEKSIKEGKDSSAIWYFDMPPIIATLNVPRATRYVRVGLTMELDFDPNDDFGGKLLEKNMPILTNWLMIYFSSRTLEEIQGGSNIKRMQMQILDSFNETLWPDAKPRIKQILFKECAIQ